jgi:hypothetical protein
MTITDTDRLRAVLADREAELLIVKGRCRMKGCRLHYAHWGPCDKRGETS